MRVITILVSDDAEPSEVHVDADMDVRTAAHAIHQAWAAVDAECNDMVFCRGLNPLEAP